MNDLNPVISEFVEHYVQKVDFYGHLASMVEDQLRSELGRRGIRAIVNSRAKDPTKLREKLIKRSTREESPKTYRALKDIEADIVDLAGVRVALYFPGDQKKVGQLIEDVLEMTEPVKSFPEEGSLPLSKGLVGYIAKHYRVKLRPDRLLPGQRRYADARVEIQVASVLMHAWAEIDHDLRYKPTQGPPSVDELATLDEVNGLVLTGEIALERLQRSIESRVGQPDAQFQNPYELQEFLSTQGATVLPGEIGRVNYLLELLKRAALDTPRSLQRYLNQAAEIGSDGPLADRLIDVITAEDPERYQLLRPVLSNDRASDGAEEDQRDSESAIGSFLTQWIELERTLQELTGQKTSSSFQLLKLLRDGYEVSPGVQQEIRHLRSIRNKLVHGQVILPAADIRKAAEAIASILAHLRNQTAYRSNTEGANAAT